MSPHRVHTVHVNCLFISSCDFRNQYTCTTGENVYVSPPFLSPLQWCWHNPHTGPPCVHNTGQGKFSLLPGPRGEAACPGYWPHRVPLQTSSSQQEVWWGKQCALYGWLFLSMTYISAYVAVFTLRWLYPIRTINLLKLVSVENTANTCSRYVPILQFTPVQLYNTIYSVLQWYWKFCRTNCPMIILCVCTYVHA